MNVICLIGVSAKMLEGEVCDHTPAGCALDESLHDEERFVDLFNCSSILTDSCSDGGNANRPPSELVDDGEQDLVVDFVQTVFVNVQCRESNAGDACVDAAVTLYLGEVSDAS